MSSNFEFRRENSHNPMYGDVDWRDRYLRRYGQTMMEAYFISGDGLELQLTDDNTTLFLNATADEMDVLLVQDPRDGKPYQIWREGNPDFDGIYQRIGGYVTCVHNRYTREEVVTQYLLRNLQDLDGSDDIPREWDHEQE